VYILYILPNNKPIGYLSVWFIECVIGNEYADFFAVSLALGGKLFFVALFIDLYFFRAS